jgi:hypothetical protein
MPVLYAPEKRYSDSRAATSRTSAPPTLVRSPIYAESRNGKATDLKLIVVPQSPALFESQRGEGLENGKGKKGKQSKVP